MTNRIRLKDIICKKQIVGENAQTKNQTKHIQEHQQLFEQLSQTLTSRPLTFAKFSFKKPEMEFDDQLKPIVRGIYDNEKQGSMMSTELWSLKQQRQFLKQSQMSDSKGILKRFAHWEWDNNANQDRLRELASKLKQEIYTQKSEVQTKKQLELKKGEELLRKRIIREWTIDKRKMDLQEKITIYKTSKLQGIKSNFNESGQLQSLSKINQSSKSIKSTNIIILKEFQKNEKLQQIFHDLDDLQKSTSKLKLKFNKITPRRYHSNPPNQ